MDLQELKKISADTGLSLSYLYELSKTSTNIIDILKSIRNSIGENGSIDIFINDGRIRKGIKIDTKPIIIDEVGFHYPPQIKKQSFYYPLKRKEIEIIIEMFSKELSREIGTTDRFLCGYQYPISIHKDGEYKIGFRSNNHKLVKSLTRNLVKP